MLHTKKSYFKLIFLILFFFQSLYFGCASIQQPTGGPKDSIPPKILEEAPKNFTTNFRSKTIDITFNEYFKLNNAFKEISISPDVDKQPDYKVKKKTLNITLQDTLESNTTYTINFGNAIADFNEGNVLKNYMYVFSTGNKIDSLSISGKVIDVLTKEPQLNATVLLIPLNQDTIFGKKRAHIFTTTDSSGNFSLKYLRENKYKIYALNEPEGGDKIYNSTDEEVAFLKDTLNLQKNISDIKLELFKEEAFVFRILDRKIENSGRITYVFNQKLEKPGIKILNPAELNNQKTAEFSPTGDTAYLWTKDMSFDSIVVAIQNNGKSIDTTTIRRNKRDTYKQEIYISDNVPTGKLKPGTNLQLTFSAPVGTIDTRKITLLQDSVKVTGFRLERDTSSTRKYAFKYSWRPERTYIINIEEGAIKGLYGGENKYYEKQLSLNEIENYGNLTARFTVPDTSKTYVLELLNEQKNLIIRTPIKGNTVVDYKMYSVGKYYIRVVYDENRNGIWDTGDVKKQQQPEQVWNYPTEILLRANWDLEEKITIPPLQ